jgi:hypothetical protein
MKSIFSAILAAGTGQGESARPNMAEGHSGASEIPYFCWQK